MSYYRGPYGGGVQLAVPPLTPMVKRILIVLGAFFVLSFGLRLLAPLLYWQFHEILALDPRLKIGFLDTPPIAIWQLLTYGLLHGSFWHLLLNGIGLWMFGGDVEMVLGSRGFLRYFLITVIGGGLAVVIGGLLTNSAASVLGASGGVLGLVVAYAVFFPHRQVLLVIFPVPAWAMAVIFGLMNLFGAFEAQLARGEGHATNISYAAHLGGLIVGYLYLKGFIKPGNFGRFFQRKRRPMRIVSSRKTGPWDIN